MRWMVLVLLAACRFDASGLNEDALRGPCPGQICECRDTEACAFTCDTEPCQLACERMDVCEPSCGVDCESRCSHVQDCALSCGDGCAAGCDATGDCQVECGHACDFTCRDVGRCQGTMLDGRARCERTGACDIRCLGPDGALEPALADGEEWVCPPSTSLSNRPE